jgi:hypothetical protein
MEFKQVVGNRRTIRFFDPNRPVEREKIQIMLEAANRCSRSVNADYAKGVVCYRDELSGDVLEALKTPTTTVQFDLAPVSIFWWGDSQFDLGAADRLKKLCELGALASTHGWSPGYVDEVAYPQVVQMLVGYSAEGDGGGQRPRNPLSENYFLGQVGTPFEEDPAVTARLRTAGMIQESMEGKEAQRRRQIRDLAERFGLPL